MLAAIYRGLTCTPFVKKPKEKGAVHDGAGRILYFLCVTFLKMPTLTNEKREFWYKLKETFIPSLTVLRASYPDKAAAATKRLEILVLMKSELEGIAIPNDMSLYELIASYLNAGVDIGELLSSRAETEVEEETKRTKQLNVVRSETVGLLHGFRKAIAQEVAVNESLPRDLEAQVFCFLDQLDGTPKESSARSEGALLIPPKTDATESSAPTPAAAI